MLEWMGKQKVVNHHNDVPFHVLERKYDYGRDGLRAVRDGRDEGGRDEARPSPNMIIHGDNLLALKSLLPRYEGRVKCIYIDPPYNTGNEGWVYNDNVNDPQINKWLNKVVGKEGKEWYMLFKIHLLVNYSTLQQVLVGGMSKKKCLP